MISKRIRTQPLCAEHFFLIPFFFLEGMKDFIISFHYS